MSLHGLTENSLTDRSDSYRIPLELVKIGNYIMKRYFSEFLKYFFKIPQIPKHLFLLRSTFVIEEFDQYSILVFRY